MSTKPLFQLASLTPSESKITRGKLQRYLATHPAFPARYRPLIYRCLLRLPEHSAAYRALRGRGGHPAVALPRGFGGGPGGAMRRRVRRACSALAHWAPVTADLPYVPSVAAAFASVFYAGAAAGAGEEDDDDGEEEEGEEGALAGMHTVEATMAILTRWGQV